MEMSDEEAMDNAAQQMSEAVQITEASRRMVTIAVEALQQVHEVGNEQARRIADGAIRKIDAVRLSMGEKA